MEVAVQGNVERHPRAVGWPAGVSRVAFVRGILSQGWSREACKANQNKESFHGFGSTVETAAECAAI